MSAPGAPGPGQNPALDAETRVPILIGISVAFVVVSTTAVALRMYTRYSIVKSHGLDDTTIAIAQFFSIGVSITTILQAHYGLGYHVWMVPESDKTKQLKSLYCCMLIYNLSQILTKVSFLLQYRRIFADYRTRGVCFWLLLFLIVWGVTQEILVAFSCIPASFFMPSMASKCITPLAVWYLTSAMNILTDFIVFSVPIPAVWKLQLHRKQKILLNLIFCLGFFTCIISIVRLFVLKMAVDTTDATWDNVPTSYWSVVELNCGILCACLPTLRPLLRKVFPSLSSTNRSEKYVRSGNSNNHSRHMDHDPYPLPEVEPERSSSQEVLKDREARYESPRFASLAQP